MKSKLLSLAAVAALAIGFASSGAHAQSAKFAANYDTDTVTLVDITLTGPAAEDGTSTLVATPVAEELLAQIKAPKGKELLIGVSGVANIVTFTEAKGRNKEGTSTAIAEGILELEVRYAPTGTPDVCANGQLAAPGGLTFASRRQELSVTVDLSIFDEINQVTSTDLSIEGSVTVALGLDTTAAHHFNFVAIDLEESGDYDVRACFLGKGNLSVTAAEIDDNTAATMVAIAHRMVTVQEVRAVKGSIIDTVN